MERVFAFDTVADFRKKCAKVVGLIYPVDSQYSDSVLTKVAQRRRQQYESDRKAREHAGGGKKRFMPGDVIKIPTTDMGTPDKWSARLDTVENKTNKSFTHM